MAVISIRNWTKYQHYQTGKNSRKPPWIKLYRDLLTEPWFAELPSYIKWQAVGLLLLAAEHGNRIPDDLNFIETRLHVRRELGESLAIDILSKVGWIQVSGRPSKHPDLDSTLGVRSPFVRQRLSTSFRLSELARTDENPTLEEVCDDFGDVENPSIVLAASTSISSSKDSSEGNDEEEEVERLGRLESGDLFGGPPDTPEAEALVVLADYWAFSISDRDWRWFAAFCLQWDASGLDVGVEILAATTRRGEPPKDWRRALTNWFRKAVEIRAENAEHAVVDDGHATEWKDDLPEGVTVAEAREAWAWYRQTDTGAGYRGGTGPGATRQVIAWRKKQQEAGA